MKQPLLLCYNLEGETYRKTRLLAMRFKLLVRPVKKEEYGQTLNALCGYAQPAEAAYEGESFSDSMIVMANYGHQHAQFLQALRRAGVKDIALKAVLTPTNGEWDSIRLHHELSLEREALESGKARVHEEPAPDGADSQTAK